MEIPYKHQLVVDRNAWFIRFYVWLWDASPGDINACKLGWGYLFAAPALLVRLILTPPVLAGQAIGKRIPQRSETEKAARMEEREQRAIARSVARAARGPSRPQKFLNAVGYGGAQVISAIGRLWDLVTGNRRLNWVVLRLMVIVGGLSGIAVVSFIVYQAIINFGITLIIIAAVAGLTIALLAIWGLQVIGFWDAVKEDVLEPSGEKIKQGGAGFGRTMAYAYKAIKSNTCPQIIVRDSSSKNSDSLRAV